MQGSPVLRFSLGCMILALGILLGRDFRPPYSAINLIESLSSPEAFDFLYGVTFASLKCNQEAGGLSDSHLLH